jgi:hypothetical protein
MYRNIYCRKDNKRIKEKKNFVNLSPRIWPAPIFLKIWKCNSDESASAEFQLIDLLFVMIKPLTIGI